MSLFVSALASGSNGNCYYIGNEKEAVLIDIGISCRETERRMKRIGLSPQKVKAVFISHEHSDHISGIQTFSKKYNLPVYITPATLQNSRLQLMPSLVRNFSSYEPVNIGELSITAFPKFHDAADPYSFTIAGQGVTVGIFTDIGNPCQHVINRFRECHAAFLETNYDEDMLWKGSYPFHLKRRISGGQGHLSNKQALELFLEHRPVFMSHLFLSHLSKNNNNPDLVKELFEAHAGPVKTVVASRYQETELYQISSAPISFNLPPMIQPTQLEISF